nr:ATP-binding cassette domain-containing protein [Lachnospiraceae bacterium]
MKKKRDIEQTNSYLKTADLAAGYGKRIIVDGVEISVDRGEIVTLIGPNGSGKSTLLRSIMGQLKLIKGAVYLDGRDMSGIGRN